MGSLLQNTVFGRSNYKVNTYIGGVGPTINTPALLAAKLGIAANRIKLFRVIDNDIECAITGGSYEVKGFNSSDLSQITYYRDPTGIVSGIGYQGFYNTGLIEGYFPNATYISIAAFDQNLYPSGRPKNLLKKLYIPSVTRIGNTVINENVFRSGNLNSGKIWANPILQTINSGGVEGDLVYLATGNTISYVTNSSKPSSVTNLLATAIYNTTIQLNFTPPDSINGIDFYEVYVNGVYKQDIKNSGDIISGLIKNINYNINLITVDNFYNKSVLSASLNVTTGNINLDVDAENFINTSQNYSCTDIINNLVVSLKVNNLWNKIHAAYPFIGSTQINQKFNLKNPIDTNAAFRLAFSGGGTHSINGYQTNGTNSFANTFLIPRTVCSPTDVGTTVVSGTNNVPANTDVQELGCQVNAIDIIRQSVKSDNTNYHRQAYISNHNVYTSGVNEARGIFTQSKTSNSLLKSYRNATLLGQATSTVTGTVPNLNLYIGVCNGNNRYSNQRIQFTAIHQGLSDSEVITFHSIIDTFENALGRKTW